MNFSIHSEAYPLIFNATSVGIFVSNEEGEIVAVNPYGADLFEYSVEESIGLKVEKLIPSPLRVNHVKLRSGYNQNPINRAMGAGKKLQVLKKSGSLFYVEISLSSYCLDNKRYVVAFVNDITQRVALEEQISAQTKNLESKIVERTSELQSTLRNLNLLNTKLLAEMEQRKIIENQVREALSKEKELNELKTRFVSIASHEFRTPLSGIMNSATLISKYPKEEQQEKRENHIRTIKKSVKNLTVILNDFLSLDKLENKMMKASPYYFLFDDFLIGIEEEFRDLLKSDQILEIKSNITIKIYQDKEILRNILINLISNSIKYSNESSKIKITCKIEKESLLISVIDNGLGIPEEDQKHLFERFFRASNVSTIQGTGLGLNIVKKYISLLNGFISFNSNVNQGTTFNLNLPWELKNDEDLID